MYPDFKKPCILSTDASNYALGAVLSQEINGEEHPVAYASRQLNSAETNYSATEKELLGAVWATGHFRCYLFGRKFKIITDHAALKWLLSLKDPNSRLVRWTLKLSEFDYEIIHKPGKLHSNADALSRKVRTVERGLCDEIIDYQNDDAECKRLRTQIGFLVKGGVLYKKTKDGEKIVAPEKVRKDIIKNFHDHPLSGHLGIRPTVERVRASYWWRNLAKDIKEALRDCVACQRRSPYGRTRAPIQELPSCDRPFDFVSLDTVGPLPCSEYGNKYILSIIDNFSRYLEMIPLPNQKAETIASAFVRRWILR